ncbi:hypothetical protein HDU97_005109 [Phlyctochytrium planicorne]|nr:hypothetical protein HDU97_005109 [Phlyctochytrium planicorne]
MLPVNNYRSLISLDQPFQRPQPFESGEEYEDAVHDLLELLIDEYVESSQHNHGLPDPDRLSTDQQRQLIRQLLCVRPPTYDDDVFHRMDRILAAELEKNPGLVDVESLVPASNAAGEQLFLFNGDITTLKTDFIVNAANCALLGCFQPGHRCIDNVIHSSAGPRVRQDCYDLLQETGYQETEGNAVVTRAYNLPSKFILHTAGPEVKGGLKKKDRELLRNSYWSCLEAARAVAGVDADVTVAFCCVSTGLFGFPNEPAAEIAVETVREWIKGNGARKWKVIFNVFKKEDESIYQNVLGSEFGVRPDAVVVNKLSLSDQLRKPIEWIKDADMLLIASGAGLSASAGLDYTSEAVFKKHFPVMHARGFRTFYEFFGYQDWSPQLQWGYLLSQVNLARFNWPESDVYADLKSIFERFDQDKAFVFTTNADGMFEQRGFPTDRIYTIQGDYSRIQCLKPCTPHSYWPTKDFIDKALPFVDPKTQELTNDAVIPACPNCGGKMFMNVRGGNWFLETPHREQRLKYLEFVERAKLAAAAGKKVVVLEIGAGFNTPGVLRWPMEKLADVEGIRLVRVNQSHPELPGRLKEAVGVREDATDVLRCLKEGSL